MLGWVIHMTATGTLIAVFGLSLHHKLRRFSRFRASLEAYGLLPAPLVHSAAVLLVVLEVVAVLCLILPAGIASGLAFALLALYTLAITVNLLRGNTAIDCGCGDTPTPLSGWLLLRNGVLLVLAAPRVDAGLDPGPAGWALVSALVVGLVLFYVIIERLLSNQYASRITEHG
ncbi:MAG: MauE/DoxX family redox-associated membrane protein [Pseudomonadales bacterium]